MEVSMTEIFVVIGVASALGFPQIKNVFMSVASKLKPKNQAATGVASWRQSWTARLIDLKSELENGEGDLPNPDEAVRLSNALIWEIIGGTEEE